MKKKKASSKKKSKFARDLVQRGEAAIPDDSGNLPAGATHEIVGLDENGEPVVVRRRFSIK